MIESSTLELLILYLFNETAVSETVSVQHEIENNYFVKEQFDDMVSALQQIDAMMADPSAKTVSNIMEYSRSLSN